MVKYSLASSTWNDEEIQAIHRVIETGRFTMGNQVIEFEERFSEKIGSNFSVMVNSGSSANLALLAACRYRKAPLMNPGDEVLVPAVSWSTTYYPVTQLGFTLKFVDIDAKSLNIDIKKVEAAIGPTTKAIFAVNLLGNVADWISLREIALEHNLTLLEDNCESLGASLGGQQAGTFGIGGTFSSFFSHHISTMEGGLITTNDEQLFHALRSLRAHGWTRDLPATNHVFNKTGDEWDDLYRFVLPGYNLRPLEIEAAIGKVQLSKLDSFIKVRRSNAEKFLQSMSELEGYRVQTENGESSWFGFSIVLEGRLKGHRRALVEELTRAGIDSRPIVTGNFTRNPVISLLEHAPIGPLPVADEIHEQGLFVGNHHYDLSSEFDLLFDTLSEFKRRF
jgi:CDP-6-deoxy-D-xylo-4-hexulose-3-dehydrase